MNLGGYSPFKVRFLLPQYLHFTFNISDHRPRVHHGGEAEGRLAELLGFVHGVEQKAVGLETMRQAPLTPRITVLVVGVVGFHGSPSEVRGAELNIPHGSLGGESRDVLGRLTHDGPNRSDSPKCVSALDLEGARGSILPIPLRGVAFGNVVSVVGPC